MASWSESGGYSGHSSTTGSASGSGRDGASASAASCSSLLGPEAALELLPCAALVFSTQGQLMGVNSKAGELHSSALWSGAPLSAFTAGAELRDGRKLAPDELQNQVLESIVLQFYQQVKGPGPPKWLLSQASLVPHPVSGAPCVVLVQVDISEAKQMCVAHAASEERTRERMQALQRKLVRAVTEAEALRHVVDRLQAQVLALRRQMQSAGVTPELPLDESILRPSPHQDMYAAMLSSVQDSHPLLQDPTLGSVSPGAATPVAVSAGAAPAPAGRLSSSSGVDPSLPHPAFTRGLTAASPLGERSPAEFGSPARQGGDGQAHLERHHKASESEMERVKSAAAVSAAVAAASHKAQLDALLVSSAAQKAQLDKVTADAVALKAGYDKASADAAEFKAGYDKVAALNCAQKAKLDKVTADAAEFKAGYDKLAVDAVEQKAVFDKIAVDSAEQKAQLDKLTADAAEYKAGFDKALYDNIEQKAQLDKVTADAAEFKAGYDKLAVDAVEQKAVFDKIAVDSAEQKAQFDKLTADAAEYKAGFDKALFDNIEQKAQLDKVTADAAEFKAGYDKLAVDAVEQKAVFDKIAVDSAEQKAQLDKLTADAAEYKAGFDKALYDNIEQKAHLDKVTADAAEFKAGYDKLAVDAVEQKAVFDKIAVDSAEQKAQLDKLTVDAAEYKAGFDKALYDNVEQKAQLDKAAADAAEFKAGFDKAAADAAEFKAGYDKVTADAAEFKAGYDKAAADAAEFKAGYDKLTVDVVEQQAQLDKAAADAAEFKAGFDKAAADAAEFKAGYDKLSADVVEQEAQLNKVSADAAEFKAGYDKLAVDAVEQKAQVDKLTADAAEFKAGFDKALADNMEQKAEFDEREEALQLRHRAAAEAAERHRAAADRAAADLTKMAADMSDAHEALLREREALNNLQDQHEQLLRAQEVLQAELSMALGSYQPKATIDAGTPADKLLAMMTELLDGSLPNLQDILTIQSTILESRDIYQPFRLGKQLMEASALGDDVGMNLIHLLGDADSILRDRNAALRGSDAGAAGGGDGGAGGGGALSLRELCARREKRERGSRGSQPGATDSGASSCGDEAAAAAADPFGSLTSALAAIISAPSARMLGRPFSLSAAHGSESSLDAASGGSVSRASAALHGAAIRRKSAGAARRGSATGALIGADGGRLTPGLGREGEGADSDAEAMAAAAAAMGPSPAMLERAEQILATSHEWQFDAFALSEATQGHPLSTLAFYMFQREELVSHFGISPLTLARFLRRIEEGYRANPYHNATHAADVLQSLSTIIHRGGMSTAYVDPLYMLACYTAASIHDFEHGGLTNDFLVSSTDPLAVIYNDKSPLENHHLAAAFTLLQQPEFNFTSVLSKPQAEKFRKAVIELVLATDMKQHFSILSHFTTVHRLNAAGSLTPTNGSSCPPHADAARGGPGARPGAGGPAHGGARPGAPHGGGSSASGSDARSALDSEKILLPLDENERLLSLQMALKCADVGHLTGALPVHKRWVERLEQEFFHQGDVERANGMPISPLFDRDHAGITRSQVGFFDIVAIPLYSTLAKVFTGTKPLLVYLLRNYRYWVDAQQAAAAPGGGGGGGGAAIAAPKGAGAGAGASPKAAGGR
ncbi:hypothetical protein Rsub_06492 [Raphidocelis subcapitata]|uniref:Phosphodiesterase n=1 Tax=Raphidocelis subcapitata TaxID=307507 RepID=A0A2V0P5L7_9CHLO|nr:hypothetical protein Rsub_06492 [Raphidocelis subcapitata]|eukprot:GBF94222.1 hypothetical protein Rsub_06492 [Raphidocelis subcapitata]